MKPFFVVFLFALVFSGIWQIVEKIILNQNHPLRTYTEGPVSRLPIATNCKDPRYKTMEFQSSAISLLEVAKFRNPTDPAGGIAREQIKFARGYYQMEFSRPQHVIPLADQGPVILKVETVPYEHEIVLDKVPKMYRAIPESLIGKVIPKKSWALKVSYKVKMEVVICGEPLNAVEKLPLTLPLDPYLAFWDVPAKNRQILKYGKTSALTNPCSHDQGADLSSPAHYWYVWRPESVRGQFDCNTNLPEGTSVIRPKLALSEKKTDAVDLNFEELQNVDLIRFSQIFGYGTQFHPEKLTQQAQKLFAYVNSDSEIPALVSQQQDISSLALFEFMKALEIQVLDLDPWKIQNKGSALEMTSQGRLRHSHKKIQFHFRLGSTVSHHPGEKHWDFLRGALQNSHVVLYSGHADMGKSFDLSSFRNLDLTPPYQFIGVLSCFSNSYFEKTVKEFRTGTGKKTDLLLSAYEGDTFIGLPLLIKYMDVRLAHKEISLFGLLSEHFASGEKITVQRF